MNKEKYKLTLILSRQSLVIDKISQLAPLLS